MVGSALVRRLAVEGCEILTRPRDLLDLQDVVATHRYLADVRPDAVLLAAAKVGGIGANAAQPATFLSHNLAIQHAVITGAFQAGVEKLLFLGSSCIYPKHATQPLREDALMAGPLEPTNEAYAIAKIAGIKLCQAYRSQYGTDYVSVMPCNLYGPCDTFDLETAHVLPALMRKAHEAKRNALDVLTVWGTGTPRREFLHVNDAADALVHVLKTYSEAQPINVGAGHDVTVSELAELICDVVGYAGRIIYDHTRPDGTARKLLSCDRLRALGWRPRIALRDGLDSTYQWFQEQYDDHAY